jgi:type VI protein secretion system component Hcp
MAIAGIAGETALVLDAWTLAHPGDSALGGGGGNDAEFGPFVVSQALGATSPALLDHFATGKHFATVTIKLLQPGSTDVHSTTR